MTYNDFRVKLKKIIAANTLLWQQTHIMFIPKMNKIIRENPIGEEQRVRYDINNVWEEFSYKENKVLFFADKYLNNLLDGLSIYNDLINQKNIAIFSNHILEEAIYYFDSFISSFYTLIEPQQKDVLCQYLGDKKVNNFFPTRNEIGLYWQIYMLRNRIIHFTNGKYDNTGKECIRYCNFSSNIEVINITDNGELQANCTLIDINKCEVARRAIGMAIKDRKLNPFDILFPNETPKGYGKKKPFLSVISGDIFFDHLNSGIMLVRDIHNILDNINRLFLEQFMLGGNNSEETLNSKTSIVFNGKKISYSIYDVFYRNEIKEEKK